MNLLDTIHQITSEGFRIEFARGDHTIYIRITDPYVNSGLPHHHHFTISNSEFDTSQEQQVCKIIWEHSEKAKKKQ